MGKFKDDFYYEEFDRSKSPGPGPDTPPMKTGGKQKASAPKGDVFAWVFAVGLLFVLPPLGVALMVWLSLGDKNRIRELFNAGREKVKNGAQTVQDKAEEKFEEAAAAAKEKKAERGAARSPAAGGKLFSVLGWILIALGALGLIGSDGLRMFITFLCVILGGGTMLLKSALGKRKAKEFARCITVSGTEGIVELSRLAETLGMKPEALEKQLNEMIERGYYGDKAYIDHARSLLVIDPADMRDVYRREDEEKKSAAERSAAEQLSEYERILAQIRQADEDIADESMSTKIRKMEALTSAIFAEVEAHPEKRTQITRFMNYYLPTTLKLLNSYARIEAQGVSGENMAKAKADIEGIADTLVEGYEKQLDTLYRAEAMDIAGDVSVIEKMMKDDGVKAESPFAPKEKGQAQGQVMGGNG